MAPNPSRDLQQGDVAERRKRIRQKRVERRLSSLFRGLEIGDVVPLRRIPRDQVDAFARAQGYRIAWEEAGQRIRFHVLATPLRRVQATQVLRAGAVESQRRSH
jgi:hypothetical protein